MAAAPGFWSRRDTPKNSGNLPWVVSKLLSWSSLTTPAFQTILATKLQKIANWQALNGTGKLFQQNECLLRVFSR